MEEEMACDPKAYYGICENKLAYIRTELRALGLTIPDDHHGRITSTDIGVEAEFRYTPHLEELWLKIHTKPFFIPCGFIFARLESAIANYRAPGSFEMGPEAF